jgi:hypothetical protein
MLLEHCCSNESLFILFDEYQHRNSSMMHQGQHPSSQHVFPQWISGFQMNQQQRQPSKIMTVIVEVVKTD